MQSSRSSGMARLTDITVEVKPTEGERNGESESGLSEDETRLPN